MRKTKRGFAQPQGFGLTESCGCAGSGAESWTELEAYPEEPMAAQLPAFLADSAEWAELYHSGITYRDGVRMLLGPEGEALGDPEVDLLLERITDGMEPADAAEFLSGLGRALQGALPVLGQVAQAALPVVGGAVGSIVAPGIGTALGGALGSVAGNLIGQAASRPQQTPQHRPQPAPVPAYGRPISPAPRPYVPQQPMMPVQPMMPQPPQGQALQQLLALLNNPQLLGGIANAALGGPGAVPGGAQPLAPLLGNLAQLAQTAAAEAAAESPESVLAGRLVNAVRAARP